MRRDHYDHIIQRERGFKAYFEEHGERVNNLVSLDLKGGEFPEISSMMNDIMMQYNVAGIFVTNSRVHMLGRYLAEKGAMNLRLIGYDLLEQSIDYLKREYIDFLISQSPEEQAYMGIRSLFEMMVLEKEGPGKIMLPIDILTKENIDYYLKFNAQYEQPE
jgi:LacI family transcriptional regulator